MSLPSPLADIRTIWDDDFIVKTMIENKEGWKCLWCEQSFRGINATKALAHVSKSSGKHIKACKGKIDDRYAERYRLMWVKSASRIDAKKRAVERLDDHISSNQATATEALVAKKPRKYSTIAGQTSLGSFLTDRATSESNITPPTYSTSSVARGVQPSIDARSNEGIDKVNEATLELAIADMIHSEGLPFSLSESLRFRRVLKLARCVPSGFKPPSRQLVAGDLLDINFEKCIARMHEALQREADTFGLTFLGDGATVRRLPLINVIGSIVLYPLRRWKSLTVQITWQPEERRMQPTLLKFSFHTLRGVILGKTGQTCFYSTEPQTCRKEAR